MGCRRKMTSETHTPVDIAKGSTITIHEETFLGDNTRTATIAKFNVPASVDEATTDTVKAVFADNDSKLTAMTIDRLLHGNDDPQVDARTLTVDNSNVPEEATTAADIINGDGD